MIICRNGAGHNSKCLRSFYHLFPMKFIIYADVFCVYVYLNIKEPRPVQRTAFCVNKN